jgi:integrase
MTVANITENLASRLLPGQTVWDEKVKGFGIRRQRSACVYILKYRAGARQRFITIGRHGSPWTAGEARTAAKRYLHGLLDGRKPANRDSAMPTFNEFSERYLSQHAAARKKPRSLLEDRRNLHLHILPSLGDLRLDKVTKREVVEFHAAQHARPVNANRCLSLISHIFSVAEKWDVLPVGTNPCSGVDRYPEKSRERLLDGEELSRLGAVLAQPSPHDWRAYGCIMLLIITGARLGEVLGLQWSWINWERGFARLPDSKTGAKTIPLPVSALELLAGFKATHHVPSGRKHVFPGSRPGEHFKGIQKPWQVVRAAAGLEGVRIHDLRHCYASVAVAGGESLYIVGSILGHRSAATTQRYAHLALEPVREAAHRTAERLSNLLYPSGTAGPRHGGPAAFREGGRNYSFSPETATRPGAAE